MQPIHKNIARIAKRCPENITSVVKCVKLLFSKVPRKLYSLNLLECHVTPSLCTVGWFSNLPIQNFSDTPFDLKSPVDSVLGPLGGDNLTDKKTKKL